jgi:serine protease Do
VSRNSSADLQARISDLHTKVSPSVVALLPIGTGRQNNVGGSGTVVTSDGLVLTAGHCFDRPGIKLRVQFDNGVTANAVTLGHETGTDYGLVRITDEGEWPAVEIGDPAELVADEVCVMYGHPDGFKEGRPSVPRLGTYAGHADNGMLRTSCIMMPGDSGGPLFNLRGQVVGINSEIEIPTTQNFHVSVAPAAENWERLLSSEVWKGSGQSRGGNGRGHTPAPEPSTDTDPGVLIRGGMDALRGSFEIAATQIAASVVRVRSNRGEDMFGTLGLVVGADGLIVSKSSRVGDFDIRCDIQGQQIYSAEVVQRDAKLDLVLLRIDAKGLAAANLGTELLDPVGTLLGSVGRVGDPIYAGVLGAQPRMIASRKWGIMGVTFQQQNAGAPKVRRLSPGEPAEKAGILEGDLVTSVMGQAVASYREVVELLRGTLPFQTIALTIERDGLAQEMSLRLGTSARGGQAPLGHNSHPADYTVASQRSTGFASAFQHDMPLEIWECGGPVIDLDGRVIGLNISRLDRSGSLALPAAVVRGFVEAARQ